MTAILFINSGMCTQAYGLRRFISLGVFIGQYYARHFTWSLQEFTSKPSPIVVIMII